MLPFRQSSLVQQPDGEITRAVIDSAAVHDEDLGIQFDLGLLGLKVAQEGHGFKDSHPFQTQISLPGESTYRVTVYADGNLYTSDCSLLCYGSCRERF